MSFEQPVAEPKSKLHALILTIEGEVEARKTSPSEQGDTPYFAESFRQGDRAITLIGTKHTSQSEEIEKDVDAYRAANPDVVLHEGNDLRDVFPGMSDEEIKGLDPAGVMGKKEQVYVAWQAFKDGKEVKSWDLTFKEQMLAATKSHSHDAVVGCFVTIALGHLYEQKITPTREALGVLLPVVLPETDVDALRVKGVELGIDALEAACQKYLGRSFAQLAERFGDEALRKQDNGALHGLFDPAYRGETNDVLRDMNTIRDQHALDVIEEMKAKHGNILVIAGASHPRAWRPAIAELYKETSSPNSSESIGVAEKEGGGEEIEKQREAQRTQDQESARGIADELKTS